MATSSIADRAPCMAVERLESIAQFNACFGQGQTSRHLHLHLHLRLAAKKEAIVYLNIE